MSRLLAELRPRQVDPRAGPSAGVTFPPRQSLAGPPAERVPDQSDDDIRSTCAAPPEFPDVRQAVGEEAHRTRAGAASPPTARI
jgi:hypothetical protein